LAMALAALEIALKEAPTRGWSSSFVLGLLALSVASGAAFVRRTLSAAQPIVDLSTFADRSFTIGCVLSFVLGIGLFGSIYLMPVFLAFVREHDAFEIGKIMLATGLSQLLVAPIAVALEQRVDARLLTAFGFGLFALGLALSGSQTPETDFDAMFWPQIIRGAAIMFCLLPPTRLALGHLDASRVPDASGLFNLMRNLGGAIGLAMIDTVIYCRSPVLGAAIMDKLQAGDIETARFIGIPLALFAARPTGPLDAETSAMLQPFVEKAAMVRAINEAWMMIAVLTVAALLCVPFAKKPSLAPARASRRKNAAATL
jgi:DHA2 family multidrug resistance protein